VSRPKARPAKEFLALDLDHSGEALQEWGRSRRGRRSEADVFDRWPSRYAFQRSSFCQCRGAFLLRGMLEPLACATGDFVVAAARAPNNVTIEILGGQVPGFAGTH
jgi:hypothetical protein